LGDTIGTWSPVPGVRGVYALIVPMSACAYLVELDVVGLLNDALGLGQIEWLGWLLRHTNERELETLDR
jgi:hypothetical protein